MKNPKLKKYFATMMTAAMITLPAIQPLAETPFSNVQDALDIKAVNTKVVDSNSIGERSKSSTGEHVITLITGDVVTVTYIDGGKSVISVESADKNDKGTQIMTFGKETYVIPNQAMQYVASGLLDQDLFNITALIANGYDDENQSTLPVIVQYEETKARFDAALPATLSGSKRTHVLESIGGIAVSTDKEEAKAFWDDIIENASIATSKANLNDGIMKIWLDGRVEANLQESVPQVGAPTAWDSGYDGTGITVAVLDTGIDTEHPDVAGQIDEAVSFIPNEDELDHHGHGTHVASTVLGTGAASDGDYKGVAPGANLIVGKVLSKDGYGLDSWVIEGMEWAAQNAEVVNMSLGDPMPSDGTDPMSQAVNELSKDTGALFVIAAGNSGQEGIGSPGAADAALTVGSVTKDDALSGFSSKGPRFMESGLKPDLVAPGSDITAARSHLASQGSGSYLTLGGTSMASPHVAGAAAILSQRYPDWTGEQLKSALMSTTKKLDEIKPYEGGAGRLDVLAAVSSSVYAKGSLDFGFFDWPHEGDSQVEKTVTYTNVSDQPVILDLSASFTDNTGSPAPEGLLQLSANQLTVPAKGTAQVAVTVDPELGVMGNRYQGQLSANVDGQTVAHTAMVMGKEEERFSLTINATDRHGNPGTAVVSVMSSDMEPSFIEVTGEKELRLPPGIYSVMAFMDLDTNTDHRAVAILGNPEVNLDGSKTVELDARDANEITVNVADKTESKFRKLEYYRSFSEVSTVMGTYVVPLTVDKLYAAPTAPVKNGEFEINTRWRLTKPAMSINNNGVELDSLVQVGSTLFEGEHQLNAVYAGKGAPNDYKGLDVKDKVVLVDRSDEISGSERAAAAHAAGAKLIITVNDGPTELIEWVGTEDGENQPIAATSVSAIEGKELIKASGSGGLILSVEGSLDTPYLYDLIDDHQTAVPKNLTYSPTETDLVKINAQYNSDRPAFGKEFRWDMAAYRESAVGFPIQMSYPSERTEWVSAPEGGTFWYHQASVDNEMEIRQPLALYQPGQRLDEEWFAPVIRPNFGEGFWTPERFANDMHFNVPDRADSGIGNTGMNIGDYESQKMKLYQGDKLVQEASGQLLLIEGVPSERTKYRLVNDSTRDESRWSTSVSTHTEWTIWSELQEEFHTYLPMISLDYKVDTDMKGNAIAGDNIKLGLSASQLNYAIGNGEIKGASLEVSFNEGKTWEEAKLVREGEVWTADISNSSKSGTFVSLRASAWDDLGNRIDQEVIKAFGVSESEVTLSADKLDYSLSAGTTNQIKVKAVTTSNEGETTEEDVTNKATYVVENDTVASVNKGLITAKSKGSTKVVISYGGKEVTVNVTVTNPVDVGPGPGPIPGDPKPETPPVFTDITNTFAKDEINKLAAEGIIQGKTETTFAPNAQITRAEFAVLLARALDLPLKTYEGKFDDVNTSKKWAFAAIEAAANAGIVNGTMDGKFNPDAPIKREEIAALVVRALEYQDKTKLEDLEIPANFNDHGSIGSFAIDSVYKATALGIIKGTEGQFNPKNNATRAEAAVMLYRTLDTLKLLN